MQPRANCGLFDEFEQKRRSLEAAQPTSDFDKFVDDARKLKPPEKSQGPKKRGKKKE